MRVASVFNAAGFDEARTFLAACGAIFAALPILLIRSAFSVARASRCRHPGV
jgi:hypothetical protein